MERLTGEGCAVLPARDMQFSRAAMSRESAWQRLGVLEGLTAGRMRVLCASVEALLDRCAPPSRFRDAVIELTEGGRFPPDRLMDALMRSGYERVPMVEGRGQCAMRGAIVDVFPANAADALRIEFFDDEIDSLRRFDCISQRSIARIKGARIAPATECLISGAEAAAERLKAALEKGIGHAMASAAPAHAAPGPNGLAPAGRFSQRPGRARSYGRPGSPSRRTARRPPSAPVGRAQRRAPPGSAISMMWTACARGR